MCKTVLLTALCPRCFSPYAVDILGNRHNIVTIQQQETILCQTALLTKRICYLAVETIEELETFQSVPSFTKLGEDFCNSCLKTSQKLIPTFNLPTNNSRPPTKPEKPDMTVKAELGTTKADNDKVLKGGISFPYFGYPVRNRRGRKPNIWVDVLDGNHILAIPRGQKEARSGNVPGVGKSTSKLMEQSDSRTPRTSSSRSKKMTRARREKL